MFLAQSIYYLLQHYNYYLHCKLSIVLSKLYSQYFVQEHVNKIDFDYKEYAKQRFQEYWSRKYHLLSPIGSSHDNVIAGKNT